MKKILAIALALVLVLSMGMIVLADDTDLGTEENPYQVNNPMQIPSEVTVPAESSVWYNFSSSFFDGMVITAAAGLSCITVDGEAYYTRPILQGAIEAPLEAHSLIIAVAFVNDGDEEVTVSLEFSQPLVGVEDNKLQLEEGINEITMSMDVLSSTYGMYFTEIYVDWEGGIDVNAVSTTDGVVGGFKVLVSYLDEDLIDQDVDLAADEEGVVTGHVDIPSYTGVTIVIVCEDNMLDSVELTVVGPALGSEARPIEIYGGEDSDEELDELVIPANTTVYVNLCYFNDNGVELWVDADITATINGEETNGMELTKGDYIVSLILTNENDYEVDGPIWITYPVGHMNNPEWVEDGDTDIDVENTSSYYYTYYSLNDGTVTVSLDDIASISELSIWNKSVIDDPDFDYSDYEKYSDYMANHADKDENGVTIYDDDYNAVYSDPSQYYATVTVNKGDEVIIMVDAKSDENWEPLPMEAVMTVEGPEAPVGAYQNPAVFETGDNEFTILAEDVYYCGIWTAEEDGTITVTVTGDVYDFAMGLEETEESLVMSEVDELVLDVKKGDEILMVALAGVDEEADEFVDTDVVVNIEFEAAEDSPATGATGAGVAVLLTLISGAGLAVLNKKRG